MSITVHVANYRREIDERQDRCETNVIVQRDADRARARAIVERPADLRRLRRLRETVGAHALPLDVDVMDLR
jgi:hypothetical protein